MGRVLLQKQEHILRNVYWLTLNYCTTVPMKQVLKPSYNLPMEELQEKVKQQKGFLPNKKMRTPPLWPHNAQVWFAHMEALFHKQGASDDVFRFDYVIKQLDKSTAIEVNKLTLKSHDNLSQWFLSVLSNPQ